MTVVRRQIGAEKAVADKVPPAAVEPVKKVASKAANGKKVAAKSAPVKRAAPAKKAPATKTVAPKMGNGAGHNAVHAADLAEIRARLQDELTEMQLEYERSVVELDRLQRSHSDGAGDDQADAGSKTFEREQEQSIAANRRLLMTQIRHAIERIDSGTYGSCEECGRPIPAARLKALPMATLDAACKARAERR